MSDTRLKGIGVISNNYEAQLGRPLDGKMLVSDLNALTNSSSWIYEVQNEETGEPTGETAKVAYKGMIVGCAETGEIYIYQGDGNNFAIKNWKKIGSDSDIDLTTYALKTELENALAEAKKYADTNDTDTKYGIAYDSVTKKIYLIEGGSNTEIDVSDFIKDGMLSSVVADEANNKLTFYWNTAAGIETTEIALSSIADVYTGAEGERIKVTVGTSNTIGADLVAGSISKNYLDENVQKSLALADSSLQNSDISHLAIETEVEAELNQIKADYVQLDAHESQTITGPITFDGTVRFSHQAFIEDSPIATQEWVLAQGYGQGSGGGIDLTTYATKEWVENQGFTTASYLDGILTLSGKNGAIGTLPEDTTINELLDAKADNIPFTLSQAYVTNPIGGYTNTDNIAGKTVKEILTKLLGVVEKITAPVITVGSNGMSMTIKNENNFPVTVQIVSNSWEGKVQQTGSVYQNHKGSYSFEGSVFTLDANSKITKTNGWDTAGGILEITSYSLSCYFEAYGIRSITESKNYFK